ncbi:LysR family transcriptional regulator [Serratia sp. L9]|uniref:LysR family transcriptional regulator n=1 Tax=Serratia sp. L9 TaxID=3423946 RepID=UPI003D67ECA8
MKKKLSVRWASFRDFEIIKTLIEKGSATQAAEYLSISQPAVSKAIASIEERSGKVLFIREKGRITPTKEALFFYEEILNIFSSLQRMDENDWTHNSAQTIRVITTPTIAYLFLAPLTALYIKENNGVKIIFSVVNSVDMLNELREGRADIALGNADINNRVLELSAHPVIKAKIVCLMHKSNELAKKDRLTLTDFNYRNLIMYTPRNILSTKIKKAFSEAGIEPNVIAEVSDSLIAMSFVNENVGLCLAPDFPLSEHILEHVIVKNIDFDIYDEMIFFSLINGANPYHMDYIEYMINHAKAFKL